MKVSFPKLLLYITLSMFGTYLFLIGFASFVEARIVNFNPMSWDNSMRLGFGMFEVLTIVITLLVNAKEDKPKKIKCPHCEKKFTLKEESSSNNAGMSLAVGLALGTAISS